MKRTLILPLLVLGILFFVSFGATKANAAAATTANYSSATFTVVPFLFDPQDSDLVAAEWKGGIGCPTGQAYLNALTNSTATFADAGCPTGDAKDKDNVGLLLAKTGPTANNAASGATLHGVKGKFLTELGYDLRKSTNANTPNGSHCGAGAPRFNVTLQDNEFFFVGCNSPPAILAASSQDWIRLRWGSAAEPWVIGVPAFTPSGVLTTIPTTIPVKSIDIIFDEGSDTGPDFFGAAILDNIDVNGVLVGQGPRGDDRR